MHSLPISAVDLTRLKVVLTAFKRGKWELEGEEVLAFAQAFAWVSQTYEGVKAILEAPPPALPSPVLKEVKPVSRGKKKD